MLRLFGLAIKIGFFALLVLVLGNRLYWGGRTVSDQVRIGMSHAERSGWMDSARQWADRLFQETRKGFRQRVHGAREKRAEIRAEIEEIAPSERQRLRALIKELNGSSRD